MREEAAVQALSVALRAHPLLMSQGPCLEPEVDDHLFDAPHWRKKPAAVGEVSVSFRTSSSSPGVCLGSDPVLV